MSFCRFYNILNIKNMQKKHKFTSDLRQGLELTTQPTSSQEMSATDQLKMLNASMRNYLLGRAKAT